MNRYSEQYPATFRFKVIGKRQPTLAADIVAIAIDHLGRNVTITSQREHGKFAAITLTAEVCSDEEIISVYTALTAHPDIVYHL